MNAARNIDWTAVHQQLGDSIRLLEGSFAPEPEQVERILAERADALLRRHAKGEAAHVGQRSLLLLEVGSHVAGIEVQWVREVVNLAHGQVSVPDADPLVLGVVNVHNQIVNLVNPWPLLNEASPTAASFPRAVLLRHPHLAVAIGCSQVLDLVSLPESAWRDDRLFVYRAESRTGVLLDIQNLLSRWEKESQAQNAL